MSTQIIEGVSHIDADDLKQLLDESKGNVYVIDVREPEEYTEGHIPGIPLLPMGDVPDLIEQFDKEAEYVIVCRSGRRSLEVAKFFQNEGIPKVHNYLGGMLEWNFETNTGLEHVVTEFSMNSIERKR